MRGLLQHLLPVRIGSQIAVLVVTALVLAHVVLTAGFFLIHPSPPHLVERFTLFDRLVFLAKMMDAESDAAARAHLLATARLLDPTLTVLDSSSTIPTAVPNLQIPDDLQRPHEERENFIFVRRKGEGDKSTAVLAAIMLADGSLLAAPAGPLPPPPLLTSPMTIVTLTFLASVVTLLTLWAARQLTAPLARFADAAERFTASAGDSLLSEGGPLEIRRATRALNDMQQRVLNLVAARTRMLAAVGHDLRTPITRLRLRADEIEPPLLRQKILRDLTTMQNLVNSALSFLSGEVEKSVKVKTDLPSLVQTACDGFSDMGHRVQYSCPPHLYVDCQPDQLIRAVENLIGNGLKFGQSVDVRVAARGQAAAIEIEDDGPGIPDAEKCRVTEPFYRADAARNPNENASFGLGLSIAQSIVTRNDGKLELLDAQPRGLLVRILLPLSLHA